MIELVVARRPEFRWVKGHSGDPMNDLVDVLAVAAAKAAAQEPPSASSPTPARTEVANELRLFQL